MHGETWLMWLGVALAMAAIEVVTVDFVFLMLAFGAVGGAAASFLGAPFVLSAIIAVAIAVALLFTLRPAIRHRLTRGRDNSDIGPHSIVGQLGRVVEPVSDVSGFVKVGGDLWSARTNPDSLIPLGAPVRVDKLEGATLIVAAV